MSLDVYLNDENEGYVFEYNITHNLAKMASEAGVYEFTWDAVEQGYKKASDIVKGLEIGLLELLNDEEHYSQFNPENGWGSYNGLVKFLVAYIKACHKYPDATIEICR